MPDLAQVEKVKTSEVLMINIGSYSVGAKVTKTDGVSVLPGLNAA